MHALNYAQPVNTSIQGPNAGACATQQMSRLSAKAERRGTVRIAVITSYMDTFLEGEPFSASLGDGADNSERNLNIRQRASLKALAPLSCLPCNPQITIEGCAQQQQITWSLRSQTRPRKVWGGCRAGALGITRCLIWPPCSPTDVSACQQSKLTQYQEPESSRCIQTMATHTSRQGQTGQDGFLRMYPTMSHMHCMI
jgi:hypothetical protein